MMDLRSTFEKDSTELDQKNVLNNSKTFMHEHPKIENIQWSIANEHLRASGITEHYTTIKDTLNEDISPRDSTEIGVRTLDASQGAGYPYVTFNGSEGFPTRNNDATSELYSYATNHPVLHWQEREDENRLGHSYLSLSANGHNDQEISEDHSGKSNHCTNNGVRYDNNKTNFKPGTSQTPSQYDNQKDTYLVSRQEKAKLKQKKHMNLYDIDWQNIGNKHLAYGGQNGNNHSNYSQLGSTYVDKDVRIPGSGNPASAIPKARQYRKRKTTIVIVIILLLLVAIAAVVGVLLITKQTENVCDDRDGCHSKCPKYPDVSNGHVSSTEEVYPSSMVNISCNEGFRINRKDMAVCLDSGSWSHIATCEPVDCGKYLPPDHALILESGQETTFNTSVSVTCDAGFQLVEESDSFVWCTGDGHWSGNPKCENLVDLSINPSFFLIGETAKLTCEFRKASDWRKVVFRRASWNKDSVTIASIENNIVSYKPNTANDNIEIIENSFTHDSGKVIITFETVQCSDAFEIPGDINFTCEVQMDNLHVFHAERLIRIQGKPDAPMLTMSPHVVEGEDTTRSLFVCEMLFAEPNGKVIIESDYSGTYTTLLSSVNGEYETDAAWIEDIKTTLKNCWYRMVVSFGLKAVSMKWHRKHIRCIAQSSNSSVYHTVFTSDNGVVKVLPERICQGQDLVLYPYNCGMYVECDSEDGYNSVMDVIACANGNCYNVNIGGCSQCSVESSCSVTDIYYKDGGSNEIGSALTIVCIVEDFKDLTDIKISRGSGEMVSSLSTGDNIKGISTVPEMSHRNSTGGMLSVHISYLLCDDEATYRCFPEGGGQYSDDVIYLNMNC
ncbi:uncharacterized protein LOC123556105 [Mercenaria mercenaria]|uniref:uncharacterized protein LOC123556105 n=1 Tax=Mercenaria mercenaria TaxID=6596 RepID=UPI00234F471B|nr:uncharacterized protein LOC123556105 [Mercenaria mercenaria]